MNARPMSDVPALPQLLTSKEAAAALAISSRTLWTLTNSHDIPHVRFGRIIRYPAADLLAWIEARRVRPYGS